MSVLRWRLVGLWLVAACGGGQRAPSAAGAALPASDPFDANSSAAPAGERLAFGMRDGAIRNYFVRQGPVAVHLLARSGPHPRVLAAFPAENQGIGVWFLPSDPADGSLELSAGPAPDSEPSSTGGELEPVVYERGERDARGVRATLKSTATQLSTQLVLLGNVRTLRDYGYGSCLEDAAAFPALRNETIEPGPAANTLRIRRQQIDGHSLELWLAGRAGTTLTLRERTAPPRAECPLPGGGQPLIELTAPAGIELELIALADDEPLTPIDARHLLPASSSPASSSDAPADATAADAPAAAANLERSALAFLSYDEKLLAGSWRFLTYFGRDTLLSSWLLLPALEPRVAEAALGAVLERVQLDDAMAAPEGGSIARGDVAHEEELGDYAAWKNSQLPSPPANLRLPRYDYKMIDDDFLLPPLLLALAERLDAVSRPGSSFPSFLARTRSDGRSFQQAALANLELVLGRARPFANDPRAPRDKAAQLVALHPNLSVGQWRDSEMGLAFGRYPFDVNAALVPAALAAAAALYERLARPDAANEARRLRAAWRGVEELFRIDVPLDRARANVARYATAHGLADPSGALDGDGAAVSVEYGIALDRQLQPLPVLHSDHGFVLAFTEPPDAYLRRVAALLTRPFPAGLASPAGILVANPAFAEPGLGVTDPRDPADPSDDASTLLTELFTPAHYHGTVIWSWQQALLARGLRRQLARGDIEPATRAALETAECALWGSIDATRGGSTRELWSWAADANGRPELRPFGAASPSEAGEARALPDADESNAIQLWSTVYLAVHAPTPAQNPRCAPAGVGL
jgi:hypothetical protein